MHNATKLLPLALAWLALPALGASELHHHAIVTLDVERGRLTLEDTVRVPAERLADGLVTVTLHPTLSFEVEGGAVEGPPEERGGLVVRRVRPSSERLTFRLAGVIREAPEPMPEEHARSFSETRGVIAPEGVYLAPSSAWLPRLGDGLMRATLEVRGLPEGWSVVSEAAPEGDRLVTAHPVDGLHLVAGPWHSTRADVDGVAVDVLLRSEDPALTQRYLEVSRRYLQMYQELLGPYPWARFSVVENFWETGYGMPSFTLLGPKVIRFPFLLHSSYPHELLHNWWGNGVYLKPGGGNWAEGLTAYLADHLVQEQRGKGEDYRRGALARYADYVREAQDFPLREFRGRSSRATEAVGYGKWMMVVHMLRRELGDAAFVEGLRAFYDQHRYRQAGFDELRASLEAQSGRSLERFFRAWVERAGAPDLRWSELSASRGSDGSWTLAIVLEQVQGGESFPFEVPVAVQLEDGRTIYAPVRFEGGLEGERAMARLPVDARPGRVLVDPHYDIFRRLHEGEVAPTLSRVLGAERALFALPTLASDEERRAWRAFAARVCGPASPRCRVVDDKQVGTLPDDAAVWVLGYGNALRGAAVVGAGRHGATFDDARLRVAGSEQSNGDHSVALAFPHPRQERSGLAFVGADRTAAIAGLARKLPHYGKYGYLGFQGDEPTNVLKGAWDPTASPMVASVGEPVEGRLRLEDRTALAELPPPFAEDDLVKLVRALSAPQMEGRGLGSPGLDRASALVVEELSRAGFSREGLLRCWQERTEGGAVKACNVVATLPGRDPELPAVVVGAHLDHLGRHGGKVHPGANDNASGVAALLAVARKLRAEGPRLRTVHLVAFTGEETGLRGARRFLDEQKGTKPHSMISLDTVGRREGAPFLVAGHESATEWVHVFMGIGFVTGIEARMAAKGLAASDHQPFLEAGVPAVHLFAGPPLEWHTPGDTADRVEPATLVAAAVLAHEAVAYLADRETALTAAGAAPASPRPAGPRKVSLGTVPDFSFAGPGVRLKGVVPGSPAEAAGLQEGDVLLQLGERPTDDLRALADALRAAKAGQRLPAKVRRGEEELQVEVELSAR